MYLPSSFNTENPQLISDILENYSFATLVTTIDNKATANHFPVLIETSNKEVTIVGHMAKANTQWDGFENDVLCIFNGPHSYISPTIYVNKLNVPTWNYVSVHAYGKAEVIHDADSIENILKNTVDKYEANKNPSWSYDLPQEYRSRLIQAIVGFKIKVTHLEAKFKLSQNRKKEDYLAVKEHFSKSTDANDQALYRLMLSTEPKF